MNHAYIESIIQSVLDYKEKVDKVLKGEEELQNIKPVLSGMGVYEQREKGSFMLRVRIPAGALSISGLKSIFEVGKKVKVPRFHFTSRQDIQFHGLSLIQTVEVMEGLLEKGLVTKGSGGNSPRNVACAPLSGIERNEVFDVLPYALSSCDYIMENIETFKLPRKYKIAFSNTGSDVANATATDLGFVAVEEDGEHFFKVFGGGGMGRNAKAGIVLAEKIEPTEILYYIEGMKRLFEEYGDCENRHKARIRYIVIRLGEEQFIETLAQYVEEVKEEGKIKFQHIVKEEITKSGGQAKFKDDRLIPQKQEGLYSIFIHPLGGYLSLEESESLINLLESLKEVQLRLTMNQGFYIINLTGKEAKEILKQIEGLSLRGVMERLTACTGSNTCQIGITPTEELVHAIHKYFKEVPLEVQRVLPPIHISGCLNSCGAHQVAKLGFCGERKRIGEEVKNVFMLHINGEKKLEGAKFSEEVGLLLLENIPEFLYQLAVKIKDDLLTLDKEDIYGQLEEFFI